MEERGVSLLLSVPTRCQPLWAVRLLDLCVYLCVCLLQPPVLSRRWVLRRVGGGLGTPGASKLGVEDCIHKWWCLEARSGG